MTTTLTNDQITAGAAVLCPYCGKAEGMHDHAFPHPRSAPSPQIAEKVELPPLPVLQDAAQAINRLLGAVEGLSYVDSAREFGERTLTNILRITEAAPVSAGQAASALPKQDAKAAFKSAFLSWNGFHTDAELEKEWARGTLAGEMFRAGLAAQPAEGFRPMPRLDQFATLDEYKKAMDAYDADMRVKQVPAEVSAGQAGQVATGDKPFAYVFKSTMKMLRDGCSVMGEIHPEVEPGTDLFEPIYAAPVEQGAAPSEKAAAANAGELTAEALAQMLAGKHVNDYGYRMLLNGEEIRLNLEHLLAIVKTAAGAARTPAADAGIQGATHQPSAQVKP